MNRSPLLLRSYRKHYPEAVRGEGVYLWDSAGNRYLDFSSSAVVSFVGHAVPEVAEAISAQAKQLEFAHSSQFISKVAEAFAHELLDFLGPAYRDASVFFTSGGSEAIETHGNFGSALHLLSDRATDKQAAFAGNPVHDLILRCLAGNGSQQPVTPSLGLLVVAGVHQGK